MTLGLSDLLKAVQLAKGSVRTERTSRGSAPGFRKFFVTQFFIQFGDSLTDVTIYQPSLVSTSSGTVIAIVRASTG